MIIIWSDMLWSYVEPPYAERHVRWCERGEKNLPYSICLKTEGGVSDVPGK